LEFIQQNIYLVAIAVFSGAMLLSPTFRSGGGARSLSTTQATMLINREDAQVIDVRDPAEYAAGHLADSRNIPVGALEAQIADLEKYKDQPLILICQTGTRSSGACGRLAKAGFAKVHSLDGGIESWVQAGLPIKKGTKK
jgi:rhodanese-related sulfurtransferase